MKHILVYILILGSLSSFAQGSSSSEHKLGIKTSINFSSLLGDEFVNPRPKFGYVAGPYYHFKPENKWSLYTELLGDFKGSNFKNGDTGYARVALGYITLSVAPTYKLPETNQTISFGPYVSYLGLASVYVGEQRKPVESERLGFQSYDFGIAAYYTRRGEMVSFQVGPRIGLVDVNKEVIFDQIYPATGTGGFIRNVSLDIGMLF